MVILGSLVGEEVISTDKDSTKSELQRQEQELQEELKEVLPIH